MFDNPVILNLQNFKRDSYISVICQASDYAVEDRKTDAVAHLAVARSQNTGNGILGDTKDERQLLELPVFLEFTQRYIVFIAKELVLLFLSLNKRIFVIYFFKQIANWTF